MYGRDESIIRQRPSVNFSTGVFSVGIHDELRTDVMRVSIWNVSLVDRRKLGVFSTSTTLALAVSPAFCSRTGSVIVNDTCV
jgi:hypothetical protein